MNTLTARTSRDDIEVIAESKLLEYGLFSVPVDPGEVARLNKIEVKNVVFNDEKISGFIIRNGNDTKIFVKNQEVTERKRFTIAHELGHFFLHLQKEDGDFVEGYFRGADNQDMGKEIEANQFAAALLMPREHIRRAWYEGRSVQEMAALFGVSESAMGYRLGNLGLLV